MEVWMLGGLKCARIPASWKLQIVAEGQMDSYRTDVGESTWLPLAPVGKFKFKICRGAAKPLLRSPKRAPATGQADLGEAAPLLLLAKRLRWRG